MNIFIQPPYCNRLGYELWLEPQVIFLASLFNCNRLGYELWLELFVHFIYPKDDCNRLGYELWLEPDD